MGQRHPQLSENHMLFIAEQKIFFVGTATADSRVSVSPKGMDSLRVLGPNRVLWLNLTGSGNETSTHAQQNPRMTLMFCSFAGAPLILRVYGQTQVLHPRDAAWPELYAHFGPLPGARQIFDLAVDLVQTSCGTGVPCYSYQGERSELSDWAVQLGPEGLEQYWEKKNQVSLDGLPSHILKQDHR